MKQGHWYYLGHDFRVFTRLQQEVFATRISQLDHKFHDAIGETAEGFIALSASLNQKYSTCSPQYWGMQIASRNSAALSWHRDFIYAYCARKLVDGENPPAGFICDSSVVADVVNTTLKRRNDAVKVRTTFSNRAMFLLTTLKNLARIAYYLFYCFSTKIMSRTLKNERISLSKLKPKVLLRSWITRGSFLEEKGSVAYRDRNFGPLSSLLDSKGYEVWLLPSFFNLDRHLSHQLRTMERSQERFILAVQYLSWIELFGPVINALRFCRLNAPNSQLFEIDIAPLIRTANWETAFTTDVLINNQVFALFKNLAKKGVKFEKVVYPFENNAAEKILIKSLRTYFPETEILGFQHSAWYQEQLGMQLLKSEASTHPLPHSIVTSGLGYKELLERLGFASVEVVSGPNLRYLEMNHLTFEASPGETACRAKRRAVLIILNFNPSHGFELLAKAAAAMKDMKDVQVSIKLHPVLNDKVFKDFVQDLSFPHFDFVDQPIPVLAPMADVVLMNYGSISNLEVMVCGTPLLRVSLGGDFDFNPLWDIYPLETSVAGLQSLQDRLTYALTMTEDERTKLRAFAKYIVERYFAPIDGKNLSIFLEQRRQPI